jgi:peptidoglycan/xylan/chitin deacetylase (PgdA/CDA1 family)
VVSDRAIFTTSWDDGNPLDVRIAQMLEDFGLTGTFYASTGPEGRRLISDGDLARIGRSHELGVHGRTHEIFPVLSGHDLTHEIRWAAEELSRFGVVGSVAAPPRGKLDRPTARVLAHLGYSVRTGAIIGSPSSKRGVLEPTFHFYPHRWRTIVRNLGYRRRIPPPALLLAHGSRRDFRDRTRRMLLAGARDQRYVHVWGHAAEIERLDLWDALRELLGAAAGLGLTPVSNTEALAELDRRAKGSR